MTTKTPEEQQSWNVMVGHLGYGEEAADEVIELSRELAKRPSPEAIEAAKDTLRNVANALHGKYTGDELREQARAALAKLENEA